MEATAPKLHPFEISGLGLGPFTCVGVYSLPSPGLAEQNPTAYMNALAAAPKGAGSCAHCGMGITDNYIIKDRNGKTFLVGCDCALKTYGHSYMGDKMVAQVKIAKRNADRAKREAKKQAKWEAYKQTDEYKEKQAAQQAAQAVRESEAENRKQAVTSRWAFVIPALSASGGNFCTSIIASINNGQAPAGRGVVIVAEIYAKYHGRKGSSAYDTATQEFYRKVEE